MGIPKQKMKTQRIYALVLGIILTAVGIFGFFMPDILGIFHVNIPHTIYHLAVGLIGIYCGIWTMGRGYNVIVGWVFIALAVLGFIPGISELLASSLRINTADNILHLTLGIVTLGVYYLAE